MIKKQLTRMDQNGFTLTEMIIVLVIIGLLAAIAIPVFGNIMEDARKNADDANIAAVETAIDTYQVKEGALPKITATSDTNAAYEEVLGILKEKNYLKNKANQNLSSKQNGKEFVYDSKEGTISLRDKSTTETEKID